MDPMPKRSLVKALFWPSRRPHVVDRHHPQQQHVAQEQEADEEEQEQEEQEEEDDHGDEKKGRRLQESSLLLAKLFAAVSAVKAAYARLQVAQTPYDPEAVQSADLAIVAELERVSRLKRAYLDGGRLAGDAAAGDDARVAEEIRERKNLLSAFLVTTHKLESELEAKAAEARELAARLEELEAQRRALEAGLHPKRSLSALEGLHISGLNASHFLVALRYAVRSIRSFADLLVTRLAASGWDVDAAVACIVPGTSHSNDVLTFESFVSRILFSGFQQARFGLSGSRSGPTGSFDEFLKARRSKARSLLEADDMFRGFCEEKYPEVVNPEMEHALSVDGGHVREGFLEMARRVWMLHALFFSFPEGTERGVFEVRRGSRFSGVYMESAVEEAEERGVVAFTVAPGFRIGRTVIQCKVCLVGS